MKGKGKVGRPKNGIKRIIKETVFKCPYCHGIMKG
ncbi:hypothetical protein LCGC14_0589070 [marine sediment metagenome]|uniref:Uncharacterized protein n=1 Tax=marine sediment metagenome TaxID=412755 RepID=A0A0F9RDY0_9ZZZZ